ncbi:hypothetical protein FHG87_001875 [Trinorchestia longiramus]|nr:hypothetical protein FHG87_001875 [Trinorchestia longiramus]
MSSSGGKYAVGRFFVSTPVDGGSGGSAGVTAGATKPLGRLDSSSYGSADKSRKRVRKYGQYNIAISYPEPTIHEETSPGEGEDAGGGAGAATAAAGASKLLQQQMLQQQNKARDGGKKEDGGWASGDEMGGSLGPSPRPRSGTWSLATSRRKEKRLEKEEDVSPAEKEEAAKSARLRRRRKSGDDIHKLATADATLLHQPITSSGFASRRRNDGGFFDSFRPRSKSDAKAILQARQRRRSGDDPLTTSTGGSREAPTLGVRDRKKEASPGFFESIRPRSKSDAARLANKKPNIMTTMKNAVQVTVLVLLSYLH